MTNMNNKILLTCFLVVAQCHASISQDDTAKERKNMEAHEAVLKRSMEANLPIAEDPNFSIDVTSKKDSFSAGEPTQVYITLKNNGHKKTRVFPYPVETFFEINIIGPPYGAQVPRLSSSFRRYAGSMNTYELLAGERMSGSIILTNLFDMSLAGTYKITVSKRFRLKNAKGEAVTITSNTLQIEVASDAPLSKWEAGIGP